MSKINSSDELKYKTSTSIEITRTSKAINELEAVDDLLSQLDHYRGLLFSSSYEYPGRYTRWDIGFVNPPLELRSVGREFTFTALNERGKVILDILQRKLIVVEAIEEMTRVSDVAMNGRIREPKQLIFEEERSKQFSIFSLLRQIIATFKSDQDSFMGLYGAFGYDLVFQFEQMALKHPRSPEHAELVLFLPDELIVIDHQAYGAFSYAYEFSDEHASTEGLPRTGIYVPLITGEPDVGHAYQKGKYAGLVEESLKSFRVGDMFEVVPTHSFYKPCPDTPVAVFSRLKKINPSPYGFIINLGNSEFLVGSSPEMYVRVENGRVETCPISGTIKRGKNAIEDANQIRLLLNSSKDEAELTMCTDVDRNDKSRICIPGSVRVIGRRQPEIYSHLIHTVDHVEGLIAPEYDALDAFITHMWAVTITGAPKRAAIQWIENHEDEHRQWYGGAVGYLGFNENINTGLILRTIHMKNQMAKIQAGATLLYDSNPVDEEEETLTKAAALVQALEGKTTALPSYEATNEANYSDKNILLIDHEDSFIHTLGNYFKQTGATVNTVRSTHVKEALEEKTYDLVVLSPGPGNPTQFNLSRSIQLSLAKHIPVFGVCLGLQGLIEYFGGTLGVLPTPRHGRKYPVNTQVESALFNGFETSSIQVGLYHSLYATSVPDCLNVTARTEDGVVMAIEHQDLPVWAVQFHPESIMTADHNNGLRIIKNVLSRV